MNRFAVMVLLVMLLPGCASISQRPDNDSLRLGSMTYDEAVATYGTPFFRPPITRNGVELKAAYYSSTHSFTLQNRTLVLYFAEDVLVGFSYLSSFDNDSTDFNYSQVRQIVRGETTRAEVLDLLGKPNGTYIYPFIMGKGYTVFEYSYHRREHTDLSLLGGSATQVMVSALIYFDDNGVVFDVRRIPPMKWSGNLVRLPAPP